MRNQLSNCMKVKMKLYLVAIISLILGFSMTFIVGIHSFIVPDDIGSAMFIISSNIPKLKKGTDSRLGWGFRLGRHADFQVLVELGPQKYTQPLANQDGKNTNKKRNAIDSLSETDEVTVDDKLGISEDSVEKLCEAESTTK